MVSFPGRRRLCCVVVVRRLRVEEVLLVILFGRFLSLALIVHNAQCIPSCSLDMMMSLTVLIDVCALCCFCVSIVGDVINDYTTHDAD
jgi:hypothetical protein